jgi:hypothetical protein
MYRVAYFYDDPDATVNEVFGSPTSPSPKVSDLPTYDNQFSLNVNDESDTFIQADITALTGHDLKIDNVVVAPVEFVGGVPPKKPH